RVALLPPASLQPVDDTAGRGLAPRALQLQRGHDEQIVALGEADVERLADGHPGRVQEVRVGIARGEEDERFHGVDCSRAAPPPAAGRVDLGVDRGPLRRENRAVGGLAYASRPRGYRLELLPGARSLDQRRKRACA